MWLDLETMIELKAVGLLTELERGSLPTDELTDGLEQLDRLMQEHSRQQMQSASQSAMPQPSSVST